MLVKSYSPSKLAEKSLELKLRSSSANLKKTVTLFRMGILGAAQGSEEKRWGRGVHSF